MWAMNHLVPTCYAHGYAKSGNRPTSRYIVLCHYTSKWLLVSNLKVWMRRLCLLPANNTNYFKCHYMTYYFTCAEGFTFWSVIVGGPRWSNMEGLCVQLCTMSSSQCGWLNRPILSRGSSCLWCMLCEQASGAVTMLIWNKCSRG